jgi:hypothetical protein
MNDGGGSADGLISILATNVDICECCRNCIGSLDHAPVATRPLLAAALDRDNYLFSTRIRGRSFGNPIGAAAEHLGTEVNSLPAPSRLIHSNRTTAVRQCRRRSM